MNFLGSPNVSEKEMWDVLEVRHEVKRPRKHALIQEFELFKMQKEEYITEVQKKVHSHCQQSHGSRQRI